MKRPSLTDIQLQHSLSDPEGSSMKLTSKFAGSSPVTPAIYIYEGDAVGRQSVSKTDALASQLPNSSPDQGTPTSSSHAKVVRFHPPSPSTSGSEPQIAHGIANPVVRGRFPAGPPSSRATRGRPGGVVAIEAPRKQDTPFAGLLLPALARPGTPVLLTGGNA